MAGFAVETDGADVFGLARATEAERGGGLGPAPPPPRLLTSAASGRDTNYVEWPAQASLHPSVAISH